MPGVQSFGMDVSHWDDVIDWDLTVTAASGPTINFCYAKASQLHKYNDPNTPPQCPDAFFATNWAALQRLQIPRGAYFYCEPYFTAQQMADEFFAHYTPQHGDLPPSLDVEDEYLDSMKNGVCTAAQNVQQILDFAALVSAKIWNAKPLIYTRAISAMPWAIRPDFFPIRSGLLNTASRRRPFRGRGRKPFGNIRTTAIGPDFPFPIIAISTGSMDRPPICGICSSESLHGWSQGE